MKDKTKTKTILIILALIAFATVATLLVIKIGDINKTQGAVNKQYTITYNANGGYAINKKGKTYTTWSEKATYGTNYKTQANWYKRSGYVFVGWNEDPKGKGTDWTNYINKNWKWNYKKNVTLYAIWKYVTVPDSAFNACVINSYNNENKTKYASNYILSTGQLAKLKSLTCYDTKVSNVDGIQYMTSLEYLTIKYGRKITSFNLTKNTKLKKLTLSNVSSLEKIDLSNCSNLYSINIYYAPKLTRSNLKLPKQRLKFVTIHRSKYLQKYVDSYGTLQGLGYNSESVDMEDVYEKSKNITNVKTATILFATVANALKATITKVEYSSSYNKNYKGLKKENIQYTNGNANIKIFNSSNLYFRVTTADGVARIFGPYNIKIKK